jgi:predicted aspartyl protease
MTLINSRRAHEGTEATMSTSTAVLEAVIRKAGPAVLLAVLGLSAPAGAAPASGEATVMSADLLAGAPVGVEASGLHVQGDVRASASAPAGEAVFAGLFRVDTGAAESIAPASALEAAGIAREGVADYTRADGSVEQCSYGLVRIEFLGEMREGRILFGPEDVEPAIGTAALEAVGIGVDAETRTLTRATVEP